MEIRPYDLRHSCASLMLHAGKPLAEIAEARHLSEPASRLVVVRLLPRLRHANPSTGVPLIPSACWRCGATLNTPATTAAVHERTAPT